MDKAVALKYDTSLPAPFILAKGKGDMARIMKQIAIENRVEVAHIPNLTDALIELPVGSFIPEDFYEIIAELLIFVRNVKDAQ